MIGDNLLKQYNEYKNHSLFGVMASGKQSAVTFDDTSLKAYWKFNEASGDIINQSASGVDLGAGADLQITGATYQTGTPPIGNSMLFDGVNDFGVAGTSLSQFNYMHNTTALWTVAWWMKARSTAVDEFVFGEPQGAAQIGTTIRFSSAQNFEIVIVNGGAVIANGLTSTNYVPDLTSWHFYVSTYDQSLGTLNWKMRRDDANQETINKTVNTPSNANATYAHHFARRADSSAGFGDFYISECSNWNKIMSASDQTSLYDGGAGKEIY